MWEQIKAFNLQLLEKVMLYFQHNYEQAFVIFFMAVLASIFGFAFATPLGRMLKMKKWLASLLGTVIYFVIFLFGVDYLL